MKQHTKIKLSNMPLLSMEKIVMRKQKKLDFIQYLALHLPHTKSPTYLLFRKFFIILNIISKREKNRSASGHLRNYIKVHRIYPYCQGLHENTDKKLCHVHRSISFYTLFHESYSYTLFPGYSWKSLGPCAANKKNIFLTLLKP